MIIKLVADEPPALLEADQFTAFSVAVSDPDRADSMLRAGGLGYLVDPQNACVDMASVIELAGSGADEQWRNRFDAMVVYARGRGWLTEDGRFLKAHVELMPAGEAVAG